jgi:hypothetical protein
VTKISETQFANKAVKLWHLLNDLDALKATLKERGIWRTLRAANQHDKKLIQKYFRARNAASAIVNGIGIQIES